MNVFQPLLMKLAEAERQWLQARFSMPRYFRRRKQSRRQTWFRHRSQEREMARHLRQIRAGQLSGRCGRKNRSLFVTPLARITAQRNWQAI